MSIETESVPVRSGTAAEWAAGGSVVLGRGELGVVTDTGEVRVGDGSTAFGSLPRAGAFKRGTTTLVAGTKNVTALTGVVAGDIVIAQHKTLGTVTAAKALLSTAGTDQITITSADNTDTSVVQYVVYKA